MHIHIIPIHDGWDAEETMRWLDQDLMLPNVEPNEWVVVDTCEDDCFFDPDDTPRFTFPDSESPELLILGPQPHPPEFFEAAIRWIAQQFS